MGCKLLEIMADGLYAIFHIFEAFLKKGDAQAVNVGCPSNGRRASSISALPAPAAQTSAGGVACSLLPAAGYAAAQASPPHRTPIAGRSNKRRRGCLLPPPRGRLCCRAGLTAPPYSHRWPSYPSTHPQSHTCCYSLATADETVNPRTPPRGK